MKAVRPTLAALALALAQVEAAVHIREIHLAPPPELTRADIYVAETVSNPNAVLVLCPGMNGNGRSLLSGEWTTFARHNSLGLAALSFASSDEDLGNGRGYYYAARGSGRALLDCVSQAYGKKLPLLLYGMSGGAHFISEFEEWKPECVISWCAYTAGWWDIPRWAPFNPPGIVACGDEDPRYGASLEYFLQGRSVGKQWTWVSIARMGHQWSSALDEFVKTYFAAVLQHCKTGGEWRDVDLKTPISRADIETHPTLACWLPDSETVRAWTKIHQP